MPEATGYIKSLVVFSKALVQPQIPSHFQSDSLKTLLQPPVISRGQEVRLKNKGGKKIYINVSVYRMITFNITRKKFIERYFTNYINHYVSEYK